MRINLKKEEFEKIENAFHTLEEDTNVKTPLQDIENSLKVCFPDHTFRISIVEAEPNSPFFVMSVFPEMDTLTKVVENVLNNKSVNEVSRIWKGNRKWVIEIDSRFINKYMQFTNKERTAALLHEIGHIAMTDNIPSKVVTIMQYEIAKTVLPVKSFINMKIFRPLFSLIVLDSCISDKKKSFKSLRNEINADKFVKSMGYKNDLSSMLKKLIEIIEKDRNNKYDTSKNDIANATNFVLQNIDDLQNRDLALSQNNLNQMKESCSSPYINSVLDEYLTTVFESDNDSEHLKYGRKTELLLEHIDETKENYYLEFFEIGKKKLKRIDPTTVDYVHLKIKDIESQNDKMMLITYIYSKLDIINYYIDILRNPETAKKYQVPHTENELKIMKERLLKSYDDIINYKIPIKNTHMVIQWPSGYEG